MGRSPIRFAGWGFLAYGTFRRERPWARDENPLIFFMGNKGKPFPVSLLERCTRSLALVGSPSVRDTRKDTPGRGEQQPGPSGAGSVMMKQRNGGWPRGPRNGGNRIMFEEPVCRRAFACPCGGPEGPDLNWRCPCRVARCRAIRGASGWGSLSRLERWRSPRCSTLARDPAPPVRRERLHRLPLADGALHRAGRRARIMGSAGADPAGRT